MQLDRDQRDVVAGVGRQRQREHLVTQVVEVAAGQLAEDGLQPVR
ncbi:hypothetical protein ACI789_17135 [Geodermatophilus sp. SYSU D00965]